ncbi:MULTISPECIES: hypothetical protein [unclassified Fictibacillus]|uniref:hypothetical protein n=1 Tax=unclassified Fictibacillus TaxID=2644029 RepID=UPI000AC44437|nr:MULTISPECIES: hypothetical protein [unclassified Fictibacillus]UZJ80516.1 hypothetical protein OKX00_08710 [Fictibacillus sp. KU28468]
MKLAINTIGAIVTAVVTIVVAYTKFTGGAWIVLIVIPAVIIFSLAIEKHYQEVAKKTF